MHTMSLIFLLFCDGLQFLVKSKLIVPWLLLNFGMSNSMTFLQRFYYAIQKFGKFCSLQFWHFCGVPFCGFDCECCCCWGLAWSEIIVFDLFRHWYWYWSDELKIGTQIFSVFLPKTQFISIQKGLQCIIEGFQFRLPFPKFTKIRRVFYRENKFNI